MRTCWPSQIRSLARPRLGRTNTIHTWPLDITGPFCFWPQRDHLPSHYERLANALSNLMRLPVRLARSGEVITAKVLVTEEVLEALRREIYRESINRPDS